jgi:hypothetical protein
MFHVTNTHTGRGGPIGEVLVRAAIELELGAAHIEPTIAEMKHQDLRFGDAKGNVYWHEWNAAEVRLGLLLRSAAAQDRGPRTEDL